MASNKRKSPKSMGPAPDAESFVEFFSGIDDPRSGEVDHPLLSILVLSLCAIISGADGPTAIMDFGNARRSWLARLVPFPNGIPSHDTIGRVLGMLNPDKLEKAFSGWMKRVVDLARDEVVAIDGKTLRRARKKGAHQPFVHMVSAFASANGVVLGQVKTENKSNEITAVPPLLDLIDLTGCIVTIDAMGCQREIAAKIVDKGADYILSVKENQPKLLAAVSEHLDAKLTGARKRKDVSFCETEDSRHGRNELRRCWTVPVPADFGVRDSWPTVATVVLVEAERVVDGARSVASRWYISSRAGLTAEQALAAIRAHWSIENQLHWTLDVVFGEDQSRVRAKNAAECLAVLRHAAFNFLKSATHIDGGISRKRKKASYDPQVLASILCGPNPQVAKITR